MKKITICEGKNKNEIIIDKMKYFIGDNYLYKDNLHKYFKLFFNNITNEYRDEFEKNISLYVDDKLINRKRSIMFEVDKDFSLIKDFKMQTNSLVAKYLEIVLNRPELVDAINTINFLLESLCDQIGEFSIIKTNFIAMNEKKLVKLLEPYVELNGAKCDEYDLTYEEIILIQLNLLKEIVNNNIKYDYIFILLNIPYLTNKILASLNEFQNSFLLVNTFYFLNKMELKDIFLCENKSVDFANEESINEIICNNCYKPIYMCEVEEYMNEYFLSNNSYKCSFIKKLLNS